MKRCKHCNDPILDGEVCLSDRCVAKELGVGMFAPKETQPRQARTTRAKARPLKTAKFKRKSRVDQAPRSNHRELEQHLRDEDGQRITALRHFDEDTVRRLLALKGKLS